jgi:HTH-type transcriptional regulator/antitoxin HigA
MIKNKRQRQVAAEQLRVLSEALAHAKANPAPDVFVTAHIGALTRDIARLKRNLRDFDLLQSRSFDPKPLKTVAGLGREIIRARIAVNLTHKDLADALGKKEQAIQRLEASEYSTASLATLGSIADAIIASRRKSGGERRKG